MGIPIRVVVSPRSLAKGEVEVQTRDKSIQINVKKDEIIQEIQKIIKEEGEKIYSK
jgi:prolyl-tRNA synthetase